MFLIQANRAFAKTMVLLCGLTLFAASAHSMIYMWKDSTGTAHYTNKEHEIPARYRARVKALYPEAGDAGKPQFNQSQADVLPLTNQQARPLVQSPVSAQQTKPAAQENIQPELPAAASTVKPSVKRLRRSRHVSDEE